MDDGALVGKSKWLEAAQAFQVSLGAREPIGSLLSVHLNSSGAGSVIHFTGRKGPDVCGRAFFFRLVVLPRGWMAGKGDGDDVCVDMLCSASPVLSCAVLL